MLGTSATAYGQNLAFHRDAFAFVTADLVIPNGVDMAAREVYDGISMRFVRWYDGDTGDFKSRFDILYGYAAVILSLPAVWCINCRNPLHPEPGSPGSHHSTEAELWLLLAMFYPPHCVSLAFWPPKNPLSADQSENGIETLNEILAMWGTTRMNRSGNQQLTFT